MSSLVVVGVLTTTSKEARQKVIDQFSKIVEYSKENESGVIKYAITVPRDTSDETTVYAIEEYADQKVSDDHLASEPVQALISLFGSSPAILSEAPKVYQLEYTGPKHHFTRSEAKSAQDAFIVFATAQQQEVSQTSSLTATWAAVVAKAEADESGTLMYGLVRNKEDPIEIGTIEAYVDEKGFEEHCKSGEVGTLVEENTEIGGKMSYVSLKLVTGWLSR